MVKKPLSLPTSDICQIQWMERIGNPELATPQLETA